MPVHLDFTGTSPCIATVDFDGKWHWNDLFAQLQSLQPPPETSGGLFLVLDFTTTMTPSNLIVNFPRLFQGIPACIESVIIVSTKNLMERIYHINKELGFIGAHKTCIFIDDVRRISAHLQSVTGGHKLFKLP